MAWSRLAEPADPLAWRLVREHGPEVALDMVRARAAGTGSLGSRLGSLDVDADLERADDVGAQIVVPGDELWPPALDELAVPPYCLWVRGTGLDRLDRSVAIVGSRASTAYGERVAEELGAGLAQRGYTVVSGAAYGIDGAAHRGALAADGLTVAVLAGGVHVGARTLIGMGATVYLRARIGDDVVVVNGVDVQADVESRAIVRR